jgi:hypothetical protein
LLHAVLTIHITGNMLPGTFHPELAAVPNHSLLSSDDSQAMTDDDQDAADDFDASTPPTFMQRVQNACSQFTATLLGQHGLLVHFPVVILGFGGMLAVMHRHWPTTTKVLAAASAISMGIALIGYSAGGRVAASSADFGNCWLLVFAPILFFWSGAWLRRNHKPLVWWIAGLLFAFSAAVSLIGATDPMPRGGYNRYTVAAALHRLLHPQSTLSSTALADRQNF